MIITQLLLGSDMVFWQVFNVYSVAVVILMLTHFCSDFHEKKCAGIRIMTATE